MNDNFDLMKKISYINKKVNNRKNLLYSGSCFDLWIRLFSIMNGLGGYKNKKRLYNKKRATSIKKLLFF